MKQLNSINYFLGHMFNNKIVLPKAVPYVWSNEGPVPAVAVFPVPLCHLKSAVPSLVKPQKSVWKSHSPESEQHVHNFT